MKSGSLRFHLELADQGFIWWADSPEVAGFYAAAESVIECRALAHAALSELGYDATAFHETLA